MPQDKLDNPTTEHATHGMYVTYAYHDLWPQHWGAFIISNPSTGNGTVSQGVICGRKGKTSGKNMIVSCAQEANNQRMDLYASDADRVKNLTAYRQHYYDGTGSEPKTLYTDDYWHALWRYQYGSNEGRTLSPGHQDQGGIIMGHNDLEVLVPLKENALHDEAKDDHGRDIWQAGLLSVWVDRHPEASHDQSNNTIKSTTSSWRFCITTEASAGTHSVEPVAEVSGSPAVDNNAWVHLASSQYYHIFDPEFLAPFKITYKERVHLIDLLNASGLFENEIISCNSYSSVKLGDDGKIYLNLCIVERINGGQTYRGVVLCMSYPGVTGPDPTSSWPQKGADARNSCHQVSDASGWVNNTDDAISWD